MNLFKLRQFPLLLAVLLIACQDDQFTENELIDEDMLLAIELADEYLKTEKGRFETSEKSITVLKFKDGKLLFDTNTDDFKGYQEVIETSITAYVEPGEYIFWFAGGGLSEVDSIDFDEPSEELLEDLPEDFVPHKMWVVRAPSTPDSTHNMLKYDIVYTARENGIRVRLDPKIKINGQSDTVDEE